MRTPFEQFWYDILKENNIEFQEQVSIGKYQADFIIGNFDLEIDGCQHRTKKKQVFKDKERDKYFESLGYLVLRVPMNYHNKDKKRNKLKLESYINYVLKLIK